MRGQSGFTLIELIVVIAIIAILAAVAIPNFIGLQNQARESVEKANAALVINAINVYNSNEKLKPGGGSPILNAAPASQPTTEALAANWPKGMSNDEYAQARLWIQVSSDGTATLLTAKASSAPVATATA